MFSLELFLLLLLFLLFLVHPLFYLLVKSRISLSGIDLADLSKIVSVVNNEVRHGGKLARQH